MYRSFYHIPEREREAIKRAIELVGGDRVSRDMIARLQLEISNWVNGSSDGGVNGQGRYPITMPDGSIVTIPSPAKMMEDTQDDAPGDDPGDLRLMFENKLV